MARPLSSTTIRKHAMLLHAMLAAAVKEGVLARNPADGTEVPKNAPHEMRVLDVEQTRLLLGAARRSPFYPLILFAAMTGARLSEMLGLPWRHVDLTLGTARIAQTLHILYGSRKKGIETRVIFGEPKSKQSRRVIPLPAALVEELRTLRESQDVARRMFGDRYADLGDRGPLVFTHADGKPLHQSDVRREFYRVLREARLPRVKFHGLRHGAASLRLAQGDSPRLVQELLGHSTAAFTMQVYSHLLPGMRSGPRRDSLSVYSEGTRCAKARVPRREYKRALCLELAALPFRGLPRESWSSHFQGRRSLARTRWAGCR